MAAMDFPSAPVVGQLYPTPPVAGVPVYRWDGEKWTTQGAALDVIPSGTKMLFCQAAAPAGWVQDTTHNDKALRVVSGVGGGSGGSNSFSTVMAQTVVGNHTLTLGETPAGLTVSGSNNIVVYPGGSSNLFVPVIGGNTWYQLMINQNATVPPPSGYNVAYTPSTNAPTGFASIQGSNTIGGTSNNTGGGAHNHPITMQIQYVDIIMAARA